MFVTGYCRVERVQRRGHRRTVGARANRAALADAGDEQPAARRRALDRAGAYHARRGRQCLAHCRDPVSFFARGFRPASTGALGLGLRYGSTAWAAVAVMGRLFVGRENLLWIAALSIFVLRRR